MTTIPSTTRWGTWKRSTRSCAWCKGANSSKSESSWTSSPHAGRYLRDRRGQHPDVVSDGVRAGVAGPQQRRQALGGIGQPRPERVEAVAFLIRGPRKSAGSGTGVPQLVGVVSVVTRAA